MNSENAGLSEDAKHSLERYAQHSNQLQAWIAAYGVGLAATVFIKLAPRADHLQLPLLRCALWAVAAAMALQVVLVMLNKYTQWGFYVASEDRALEMAS